MVSTIYKGKCYYDNDSIKRFSADTILHIKYLLKDVLVETDTNQYINLETYIKKYKKLPSLRNVMYRPVLLYHTITSFSDYVKKYYDFLEAHKDDDPTLNLYVYLFTGKILNYNIFLEHYPQILTLTYDEFIDLVIEIGVLG